MDILQQYQRQHQNEVRSFRLSNSPLAYGGVIRWVMKLSAGTIRNEWQAEFALLIICLAIAVATSLIFWGNSKAPPIPPAPPGYDI